MFTLIITQKHPFWKSNEDGTKEEGFYFDEITCEFDSFEKMSSFLEKAVECINFEDIVISKDKEDK